MATKSQTEFEASSSVLPEVEEDEEDDKECTSLVDEDLLSRDFGGVLVLQQISMGDGGKKGLQ